MYGKAVRIGLAAAVVTAAFGGVTAHGAVYERERYSGSDTFTENGCGYQLDGTVTFEGNLVMRETEGGQAFRVRNTHEFRAVFTNPDNGKWFVIRGHATINEIKATHVEGNIYEFRANEAGQPFVLESSDGRVVVRDRGVIRQTLLFDTLGDGVPGGDIIGEPDTEFGGPHPGLSEDFSFCKYADELVRG